VCSGRQPQRFGQQKGYNLIDANEKAQHNSSALIAIQLISQNENKEGHYE
jgi:hypothetical protein